MLTLFSAAASICFASKAPVRIIRLDKVLTLFYLNWGKNLQVRQIINPYISSVHLKLVFRVEMEVLISDGERIISAAVDVETALGIVVLSFELLSPLGPTPSVVDFRSFVFLECLGREVAQFPDGSEGCRSGFRVVRDIFDE